jgi:hypothetical protein
MFEPLRIRSVIQRPDKGRATFSPSSDLSDSALIYLLERGPAIALNLTVPVGLLSISEAGLAGPISLFADCTARHSPIRVMFCQSKRKKGVGTSRHRPSNPSPTEGVIVDEGSRNRCARRIRELLAYPRVRKRKGHAMACNPGFRDAVGTWRNSIMITIRTSCSTRTHTSASRCLRAFTMAFFRGIRKRNPTVLARRARRSVGLVEFHAWKGTGTATSVAWKMVH